MHLRLAIAAAIVIASPGWAGAETAAETIAKWGLTGVWSADCDSTPSDRNIYLRVTIAADGRALLEHDAGNAHARSEIVAADIAADLSLTVRVRLARDSTLREISYFKARPRVMRVIASRDVGGAPTVANGNIVATGDATLWLLRCY